MSDRAPSITKTSLEIHIRKHQAWTPIHFDVYTRTEAQIEADEKARALNFPIFWIKAEDLPKQVSDGVYVVERVETHVAKSSMINERV
jgi:hypothetical protein